MRKFSLFLFTLIIISPLASASVEEEVGITFTGIPSPWNRDRAKEVNYAYSLKDGEEIDKQSYVPYITYISNGKPKEDGYPPSYSSLNDICSFRVTHINGDRGFSINFQGIVTETPYLSTKTTEKILDLYEKKTSTNTGLWLQMSPNETVHMTIESLQPQMVIKKVIFTRNKNQKFTQYNISNEDLKVHVSLTDGIKTDGDVFEVDEDGNIVYIPVQPRASITFSRATSKMGYDFRFGKIAVVWDNPLEAPVIDESAIPSTAQSVLTGVATYSYTYIERPAVLKFNMPEDAVKMIYVTADNIPYENWREYDPQVGVVLPADAIFNQSTNVYIAGVDSNGNIGLKCTVNCRRISPEAPAMPVLIGYAKAFDFENLNGFVKIIPLTDWKSPASTVEADGNALILNFIEPYADAITSITSPDVTEKSVGTLEYAITSYPTPDDSTPFFEARTFVGSKDETEAETWGNQNTWFVFGMPENQKDTPNFPLINSSRLIFNGEGQTLTENPYIHLRAYTTTQDGEKVYSPVLTVKVVRTPLKAPGISKPTNENYTWVSGSVPRITYAKSADIKVTIPEGAHEGTVAQFRFDGGREVNSTPQSVTDYPVQNGIITLPNGNGLDMSGTGRLFVRTRHEKFNLYSPWSMIDVEQIETTPFYTDNYNVPAEGYSQNQLVALHGAGATGDNRLRVVDVFETDAALEAGKNTYYVYLEDVFHNPIKLVVNNRNNEPEAFKTYHKQADGKDRIINGGEIIGRIAYRNNIDGRNIMPEILITPMPTESFINYLPEAVAGDFPAESGGTENPDMEFCPDRTTVDATWFNRKVRMRALEKVTGTDSKVRGLDGTEYTLYTRLILPDEDPANTIEDQITAMEDGNTYAITCYVGQTSGSIALLPCEDIIECPDTPELFAPNRLTSEGLNAISPELNITIGNIRHDNLTYYWSVGNTPVENPTLVVPVIDNVPTIHLNTLDYPDNFCNLWVYAKNETGLWTLEPSNVPVTWHDLDATVKSIAEFKDIYLPELNDLPQSIYQQDTKVVFNAKYYAQFSREAEAVVVEATPEWLYVRDRYPTDPSGKFTSANYILIHNEDQWINPRVPVGEDSIRMLKSGDIITNFALLPAASRRGNLISESTGFALTVWFQDSIEGFKPATSPIAVDYENPASESYYRNIELGENWEMRHINLLNVKVNKEGPDDDPEYTLVVGEDDAAPVSLAFDIFEECLNGWDNAYDPENHDALYDIKGILIRNEHNKENSSYALAMIDFDTNNGQVANPNLFITEATDKNADVQQFVNELKINIEHEEGTKVFYSTNGLDPRTNVSARIAYDEKPFTYNIPNGQDRVTIKAYAYKAGKKPSATVSRIFVRNSTEVQYILNYLDLARAGRNYRFTSNLKIIATGGHYMFLAGSMGNFLPVYNEEGWDSIFRAGRYVTDFTVGYKVDDHGNRIAMATGHMSTFKKITSPKWEGDKQTPEADQFHAQPDTITAISPQYHVNRLVTLMNVTVNKKTTSAPVENEELWTISEPQTGSAHSMIVGRLGKVDVSHRDDKGNDIPEDFIEGGAYNLTGFVMLGEPTRAGEIEFWPLKAERVTRTGRAMAEITNTMTQITQENGDIIADFYGTATVTLDNKDRNTTIYYMIDSHNEELSNAVWYTYQHPILINSSEVIRVKCQAPGFAESNMIIITLNKVEQTGNVSFNVTSEYGKTTVRLSAEDGAAIYYGRNDPSCRSRYSSSTPLVFTQGTVLYARAQVPGKPMGAVSQLHVMVVGGSTSTVSGKVKFELDDSENGSKLVKISPVDDLAAGSYTIYYTTESGIPFSIDAWTRYNGAFELTRSTTLLAVLMENDKPVGEVSETYVFVAEITGIEGVGSEDRGENAVRVVGSDIIAPEDSQVFDITGRRVNPVALPRGIYIVTVPRAKAIKVKID
ncbi:MAG: hypothetical protein K2G09_08010 [Paramuribaculum sp.]|nr:hypothetical protein [Paramuribaculum sp.]